MPFHPPESLLYRSRKWLAEHRDDGQQAYNANWVSELFNVPDLPPDHVHILVVTDERRFLFVDIIVTCLTCSLVLEGLDFVGDIVELASNSTPAFCVSTAVLLIMAQQNAKKPSNHSGTRSPHHRPVSLPSLA